MTRFGHRRAALKRAAFFIGAVLVVGLAGCASADRFGGSRAAVAEWGAARGFDVQQLQLRTFRLLIMKRVAPARPDAVLNVYIEGDGAAWPSPFHPPRDPTPLEPMALAMAAADPSPAVAYLGRPCQYLNAAELAECSPAYWTDSRFAPEVVNAYMAFIDRLKLATDSSRVRLIGYSGGGVLATLLAARRNDVDRLVTVAAPIAVAEWTAWHKSTPLIGSMDPVMAVKTPIADAVHFVGGRDDVVPPRLVAGALPRIGGRLREVADFDHVCCWSRDWSRLLEEKR